MIQEEYKRLLQMLDDSLLPGKVPLEEILQEAVVFFETLRKEFPSAPKEGREEMVQMMTTLHAKLQEISKITAKASGMTEDELAEYAENPSNFSPEQWQSVQDTRKQLYDSARKFSSTMDKEGRKEGDSEGKKHPSPKRTGRTKRKDWTKS